MRGELQADAAVLQERDVFTGRGWIKVIAPAKVNLHLAIGAKRADGYHDAISIMHALSLHDTVYVRALPASEQADTDVRIRMVGCGDVEAPAVEPDKNIAVRAARALRAAVIEQRADAPLCAVDIRIEKNIPAQAGLGGGSTDAAAVLVGLAKLWQVELDTQALAEIARTLGADVPFFLHGGCVYLDGAGDCFHHALDPRHDSVVLVKPADGVSTAAAYAAFDEQPTFVAAHDAEAVRAILDAAQISLFNNLAPAAERLMPELAQIRCWLEGLPGVRGALLCGSGSTTFAPCDSFENACQAAAQARAHGYWARTTAFSAIRAAVC